MAGLGGKEAGVIGDDAGWRRRLDSSSLYRRRLQWWPDSSESWRSGLAEFGRFREGEEERKAGIGSGDGVLLLGVDGGFL
jgi:hypothetical protein